MTPVDPRAAAAQDRATASGYLTGAASVVAVPAVVAAAVAPSPATWTVGALLAACAVGAVARREGRIRRRAARPMTPAPAANPQVTAADDSGRDSADDSARQEVTAA